MPRRRNTLIYSASRAERADIAERASQARSPPGRRRCECGYSRRRQRAAGDAMPSRVAPER